MAIKGKDAVRTAKPSEQRALDKKARESAAVVAAPVSPSAVAVAPPVAVASPIDNRASGSWPIKSNARDLAEFPDLVDVLPSMVDEYLDIARQIKDLESRKKALSDEIGPLLVAAGHESIRGDGWTCTRSCSTRKTIKPELLLAHGVAMAVIEDSTEVKSFYILTVRQSRSGGAVGVDE